MLKKGKGWLMIRSVLCAWVLLLAGQPLLAYAQTTTPVYDPNDPMDFRRLLARELPHQFYAGVGINMTHHTGYVPNTRFNAERWEAAGKVFGGWLLTDQVRLEGTYYYLSKTRFDEGAPTLSSEQSHAVGGAILVYTPELRVWGVPTLLPTRMFGRVGAAYKWIDHQSVFGNFDESGVSYNLGGGVEIDITSQLFFRFEYEYISKIISGTNRAIDVQHTPISGVLGLRF
jgi:opacity protein-like surface antigen